MRSNPLPELDRLSAFQAWLLVRQLVGVSLNPLENPDDVEECESLLKELGPEYEEDPEAATYLLDAVDPVAGMNALLAVNPAFNLNDPLPEIVRDAVETLGNLKPEPPPDSEETRRSRKFQAEMDKPT